MFGRREVVNEDFWTLFSARNAGREKRAATDAEKMYDWSILSNGMMHKHARCELSNFTRQRSQG